MTMQNASAAAIGVPMTSSKLFRTKLCQTSRPKVRSAIQPNATEPTPAKDTPKIAIRIRRLLPMPSAGGSSRALRCSKLDSTTKTTCLLLLAVRLVDRHHLRQQGLQVLDARARRRVGREKLGRSLATEALEVLPQLDRLARVVAGLGHVDQADVVGLGLLGARIGQDHGQGRCRSSELGVGLIGRDAETGEPCLEKHLLRHTLGAMAGR